MLSPEGGVIAIVVIVALAGLVVLGGRGGFLGELPPSTKLVAGTRGILASARGAFSLWDYPNDIRGNGQRKDTLAGRKAIYPSAM